MTLFRLALAALLLWAPATLAAAPVGLRPLSLADPTRPLSGLVWYPARPTGEATTVGDTAVFVGTRVFRDAQPAEGRFPLVLLSHGWGGHDLNLDWLAAGLAEQGMVVVAINHPGSTTGDITPRTAMEIWNRPADISRVITRMLSDPTFSPQLASGRIAVIGHSFGGDTALALAGVRVDRDRLIAYCDDHDDEGCTDLRKAHLRSLPKDRFDASFRDARVTAVVAMAPGLTPAMMQASLKAISAPVMIVAGTLDRRIPVAHLRRLASELPPGTTYLEVPKARHFDFLPPCKPQGAELLREDGDEPVCDSAGDRAAMHAAITQKIAAFLDATWKLSRP